MSLKENKLISSFRVMPLWFISAAVSGGGVWIWSSSEWPMRFFSLFFPVSNVILAFAILLIILFCLGEFKWNLAHYAKNDFRNFVPWTVRQFQKGVSALLGLALIGVIAWGSVGSLSGAELSLLCALYALCLQWCANVLLGFLRTQTLAI